MNPASPRPSSALRRLSALALLVLAALLLPLRAGAATGDPDAIFNGSANAAVFATAVQPDGKVIIGGAFTVASGATRNRVARLNADGTIDPTFVDPVVDNDVYAVAVQTDGRILIGGIFATVGGSGRLRLARLNADGSLDPTFNPSPDGNVHCLNLLPDGKIFVSGTLTFIAGAPANAGIARLLPNGTFDNDWSTVTNGPVLATIILPDGKIFISGTFTSVNGEPRNSVARLNANGFTDTSFNGTAGQTVLSAAVQPDGKMVIAGSFASAGGFSGVNRLARLNADGSLDTTFLPELNGRVWGVSLQTDGKIVAVGDFFAVGNFPSITRNHIARFNPDGSLDGSFDPNVTGGGNAYVTAANFQTDGKILIGGSFTTVGTGSSAAHGNLARVLNDSASQTLSVPNAGRIQWLRIGASIEVQQVTFELSTNGGASYAAPLNATRTSGGWAVDGLNLPATGTVRARARVQGGRYNGGNGIFETVINYGPLPAAPEIAVEQPAGTDLATGSTKTLSSAVAGLTADTVFTIRNTGAAVLSLSGTPLVQVSGADAAQFSVTAQPAATVAINGTTTFTVRFAPTSGGTKSAVLSIANNDPTSGENPFIINLLANGLRTNTTGGWVNGANFTVGTVGTAANTNNWPAAQTPAQAVDGLSLTKYLNFKTTNAAIGLSPLTAEVYNVLRLTTAEDAPERDPTGYRIYGSPTALPTAAGTSVALSSLTLIASGSLSLPSGRGNTSTVVNFFNPTAYASYLVVFTGVKNQPTAANSTQIAEVGLFYDGDASGPQGGTMTLTPAPPVNAGTSLTVDFPGWFDPAGPLSYAVLIDDVVVSAQGPSATRTVSAPVTAGAHTITGRIYDAFNNVAEVTQNLPVNSSIESWRQTYFGTTANTGNAANAFDFDGDGLANLVEYAFGLDPTKASSAQLPQPQFNGTTLSYTFTQPAGVSGITYGAQSSTTLQAGDWQPVPDTGTSPQHIFSVPVSTGPKVFLRLTVTAP